MRTRSARTWRSGTSSPPTLDADLDRKPNAETDRCAAAWTSADDPLEALAILYAIEAGQPEVSQTKLEGLVEHYGFRRVQGGWNGVFPGSTPSATGSTRPTRADCSRSVAAAEDEDRLVAAAERALDGNWELLDGVNAPSGDAA